MRPVEGGYAPDFHSRYFTEDFPYGLDVVRRLAYQKGVATPHIDKVSDWGASFLPVAF
ncbi:MAG: NAD/NADP octopine/nopaline dehydrogenase family protein, partial [Prevotella sp.]|nr:NAD/NADP octopine/nopaline dehydrogenase family protein [Prevotella sp.]